MEDPTPNFEHEWVEGQVIDLSAVDSVWSQNGWWICKWARESPRKWDARTPHPSRALGREGAGRNHVLRLEQQAIIRQMASDKMPISAIARQLGVDRKTVRSLLQLGAPGRRHPRAELPSQLEPFKPYLQARLAQYPLSSVRLLEEIRLRGYTGGYDLVKRFAQPLREAREISAVVRFETAPGVQSQVDFGHFGSSRRMVPVTTSTASRWSSATPAADSSSSSRGSRPRGSSSATWTPSTTSGDTPTRCSTTT